ncbi:MAG: hypothetical protein A2V93_00345 [Ignavibacteria bacterium RBG_16_34_14]|nr:MAG: hypothetical protein A2V93_00345 [Ignavibacteria bacterium RBG_16_34_14]
MLKFLISFLLLAIIINGCNGGIEPQAENTEAGFSGKITFIGLWPDSVTRTHLVVFKNPLLSISDFSIQNIRYISNEIPFGTTEYLYSSKDSAVLPEAGFTEPGDYAYVAVAQSAKQDVSLDRKDWFVVGLYYNTGDSTKPGTLHIPENILVKNINIVCDFNNPPPQPPGGN